MPKKATNRKPWIVRKGLWEPGPEFPTFIMFDVYVGKDQRFSSMEYTSILVPPGESLLAAVRNCYKNFKYRRPPFFAS